MKQVYKNIKTAKYYIEVLKGRMSFIKSDEKLTQHINLINAFILLINDLEDALKIKTQSNLLDKLVLRELHDGLQNNVNDVDGLPIDYVMRNITNDLQLPVQYHKNRLENLLYDWRMNNIIRGIPTKTNGVMVRIDKELFNNTAHNRVEKQLVGLAQSRLAWGALIDETLQNIKQSAKWN